MDAYALLHLVRKDATLCTTQMHVLTESAGRRGRVGKAKVAAMKAARAAHKAMPKFVDEKETEDFVERVTALLRDGDEDLSKRVQASLDADETVMLEEIGGSGGGGGGGGALKRLKKKKAVGLYCGIGCARCSKLSKDRLHGGGGWRHYVHL